MKVRSDHRSKFSNLSNWEEKSKYVYMQLVEVLGQEATTVLQKALVDSIVGDRHHTEKVPNIT